MVDYNPQKQGDPVYTQYSFIQTLPIKSNQAIVKGTLYTIDDSAMNYGFVKNIVQVTGANEIADISNGVYQAMADSAAGGATEANGARSVQFLARPSWILMKAPANTTKGAKVKVAIASGTVDPDKVELIAPSATITDLPLDYLGSVVDIYTRPNTGVRKHAAADDDLVIVNTGAP